MKCIPDVDTPIKPIVQSLNVEVGIDNNPFACIKRLELWFCLFKLISTLK